jgi:hypothetical protein
MKEKQSEHFLVHFLKTGQVIQRPLSCVLISLTRNF